MEEYFRKHTAGNALALSFCGDSNRLQLGLRRQQTGYCEAQDDVCVRPSRIRLGVIPDVIYGDEGDAMRGALRVERGEPGR
jgi:hypothetical protein